MAISKLSNNNYRVNNMKKDIRKKIEKYIFELEETVKYKKDLLKMCLETEKYSSASLYACSIDNLESVISHLKYILK